MAAAIAEALEVSLDYLVGNTDLLLEKNMVSKIVDIQKLNTEDIAVAVEYYNAVAVDLGYRFADLVAEYFDRIAELPTASAVRYKNVRCKPMKRFPFLITFTIDEASHSVNCIMYSIDGLIQHAKTRQAYVK